MKNWHWKSYVHIWIKNDLINTHKKTLSVISASQDTTTNSKFWTNDTILAYTGFLKIFFIQWSDFQDNIVENKCILRFHISKLINFLHIYHMLFHLWLGKTAVITDITFERLFFMFFHGTLLRTAVVTNVTFEWLFSFMKTCFFMVFFREQL